MKEKIDYKLLADAIRIISADAIEKANSGHPGLPLGVADVMSVLAAKFLKYNPNDPTWFARDRLVLSAGHGSMLLYSFLHLAGYKDFSLAQIKSFRQIGSICAGHPEQHLSNAIETTTGPLGQGIANSVGMAIAAKKYSQKLGKDIIDNKIYCIAGDGCLMEGISYESLSLAGHLNLNNLVIIFDDNSISIDGSTDLSISENIKGRFEAMGFNYQAIDGHNVIEIENAFENVQRAARPSIIACKTQIGKGSLHKAGKSSAHGSPLGAEEIAYMKSNIGINNEPFYLEEAHIEAWKNLWKVNESYYQKWQADYAKLPLKEKQYTLSLPLEIPEEIEFISAEATRVSSGRVLEHVMAMNEKVICGSADLAGSNNVKNKHCKVINRDDFSGNFINYGVREHAMAAICNGLALSGFNPICATFFVFTDYMRPAIRLSALMNLPVLYIATHDSIGVGEDGPTHQPIEHLASFRAMPGIDLYRPADCLETLFAYKLFAQKNNRPAIFALSRQKTKAICADLETSSLKNTQNGASVIANSNKHEYSMLDVIIFASGSELEIAKEVYDAMIEKGYNARLISMLSMDVFMQQELKIQKQINADAKLKCAIEAGSSFGWHKIIGEHGMFFGIDEFGASGPGEELYKHYGLTSKNIVKKLITELNK